MRNIKKSILVLLVVSFAFVILTPLAAQELILSKVYMKDGNVFVGEITRYESGIITIKTEYGTFNLDDGKVKYITVSESELKESYKEPCIVLKDGKVIPGKISSYISVLKRVKVSSNYGDVTIDRFKDIALIILEPVEGKPWLSGWAYRKKITIAGSAGAGTNYQVLLKIGESSGASGADFNLEGSSAKFPSGKNDGGDLRFTASDGATLQDFWVENVSGTSPNRVAKVWVKVSADLGTNQDIYCYFGNSSATNASNGDNTFLFFDDFDTDTIGTKWGRNDGTAVRDTSSSYCYIDTANSRAVIDSVPWEVLITKTFSVARSVAIETKFYQNGSFGSDYNDGIIYYDPATNININRYSYHTFTDGTYAKIRYGGTTGATDYTGDTISLSLTSWYINQMILTADTVYAKFYTADRTFKGQCSLANADWNNKKVGLDNFVNGTAGYPCYFDWVFARKYTFPEPAFSSAGSVEKRN